MFCFHRLNDGLEVANGALLSNIGTVEELTDILVKDLGGDVNVGSRLGDGLNIVADELELILDDLRADNGDTRVHLHGADTLLAEEVTELNGLATVDNSGVDGEMRVDEAHVVLVALKMKVSRGSEMRIQTRANEKNNKSIKFEY